MTEMARNRLKNLNKNSPLLFSKEKMTSKITISKIPTFVKILDTYLMLLTKLSVTHTSTIKILKDQCKILSAPWNHILIN